MSTQTTPRDRAVGASEPGTTLSSDAALYGGRYVLESKLGEGGMGQVFRARDLKLGRAVALKLLPPGTHDEQQRDRFEREARAAGALNHPNIVVVHDVARDAIEHALRVSPEHNHDSFHLTVILLLERRPAEALAAAERNTDEGRRLQASALALHDLGRLDDARRALESLISGYQRTYAYQIAEVYSWFGMRDQAFEWLERAFAQRDAGLRALKYSVLLRSLHGDARFSALLEKINLPPD